VEFSEAYMPLGLQDLVAQNAVVQSVQRMNNSLTRVALECSVGAQATVALPEYKDFAGNAGEGGQAVVMGRIAAASNRFAAQLRFLACLRLILAEGPSLACWWNGREVCQGPQHQRHSLPCSCRPCSRCDLCLNCLAAHGGFSLWGLPLQDLELDV